MTRRDDEELAELLDELEATLSALRVELGESGRRTRPRRRPPTPGEFLRFTEEYTIPTVVAVLEATIRSLELLRQVLRVANPDRPSAPEALRRRSPGGDASEAAMASVERAVAELRTALSEADLPADAESRDIVEDARELSAEIGSRVAESRQEGRNPESPAERRDSDITIDVREEDDGDEEAPVDIDAELRSIRDELDGDSGTSDDDPDA